MVKGKHILVGVSGGIAAYKMAETVSRLCKLGAEVKVCMTEAATQFILPLTLQTLSKNPVAVDLFAEPKAWEVAHISLAQWADAVLLAPATANLIGKLANGIADDMLTTTVMAATAPVVLAPAMNVNMYHNPMVQRNLQLLSDVAGYTVLQPDSGLLACGAVGDGRMPEPEQLVEEICAALSPKDWAGRRVLVTAGSTREPLDPVRYITNHSSGKMGYALARAARYRGAEVTLITGPAAVRPPMGVTVVDVTTAQEMCAAVLVQLPACDVLLMAAAVGDYRPAQQAEQKIKKGGALSLPLTQNPDILEAVSKHKTPAQTIVGFCMETENLLQSAADKLKRKQLDYIAANSLTDPEAGFGGDNNTITILDKSGGQLCLPNMSKWEAANRMLDVICGKENIQ